jgi:glutaredoxin
MIARCLKDEYFMKFMSGEKQRIFQAELFGCEWKCKLDSYIPGVAIVDLKTSANIHQAWRVADLGYCSFIDYYGYSTQLAIYQKIVDICTGEKLPCFIAVVTKEDSPEIAVINVDQVSLNDALEKVRMNMPMVLAVKNGEVEPTRCEQCDWCKATRKLMKPISMNDLINAY